MQISHHVFNFDYGFNHTNHIWPDSKFNGDSNSVYWKQVGATAIELWIIS